VRHHGEFVDFSTVTSPNRNATPASPETAPESQQHVVVLEMDADHRAGFEIDEQQQDTVDGRCTLPGIL
jgi:hypothetical protein